MHRSPWPEEMPIRSGSGVPIVNTHVHLPPNYSAFETAEQAVRAAAAEGVAAIGTSNYHDFRVYSGFAAAARQAGVVPLFGVEIITLIDDAPNGGSLVNDPTNVNRMYLCERRFRALTRPCLQPLAGWQTMRAASDVACVR